MIEVVSPEMLEKLDVSQFSKMFSYNIPYDKHTRYYLSQLKKSKQFENLDAQIKAFYEFQTNLPVGVTPKHFKLKLSDRIIDHLKKAGVADKLNEVDFNRHSFSSQTPRYEPGYYYVSVDLNQANWNVYKHFGGFKTDLDWSSWLKKEFDAPEAICMSKLFRQIIFGNLNPKRVQKFQERVTNKNIEQAQDAFQKNYHEGVVGVSHDELILKFSIGQVTGEDPIFFIDSELPIKFKIFTIEEVPIFNTIVKVETVYEPVTLLPKYRALREVPGNQFWMFFNTVILGEGLDEQERDLLFVNDGKLAKWVL